MWLLRRFLCWLLDHDWVNVPEVTTWATGYPSESTRPSDFYECARCKEVRKIT
jgi:hypothetical protein